MKEPRLYMISHLSSHDSCLIKEAIDLRNNKYFTISTCAEKSIFELILDSSGYKNLEPFNEFDFGIFNYLKSNKFGDLLSDLFVIINYAYIQNH